MQSLVSRVGAMLKRNPQGEFIDGEEIELFADSDENQAFIKGNIEQIVRQVSQQFEDPEDCFRELIQNSLDSKTKQIDTYSAITPIPEEPEYAMLATTVEDYGIGMTIEERQEFFLKLFKSSKEDDPTTIGKYGIGISSIFALPLEEVSVTSHAEREGNFTKWTLHIKNIQGNPEYGFADEAIKDATDFKAGTSITLTRKVPLEHAEEMAEKVKQKIDFYCNRAKTPIYVDGEMINKPFDLPTRLKITHSHQGLEYVVGFASYKQYNLYNNRLKLEGGTDLIEDDELYANASVLISSPYLRHTLSRDAVVRDENYDRIIKEVGSTKRKMFARAIELIHEAHDFKNLCVEEEIENPGLTMRVGQGKVVYRITDYELDLKSAQASFDRLKKSKSRKKSDVEIFGMPQKEAETMLAQASDYWKKYDALRTLKIKQKAALYEELVASGEYARNYLKSAYQQAEKHAAADSTIHKVSKLVTRKNDRSVIMEYLQKTLPRDALHTPVFTPINQDPLSLQDILDHIEKKDRIFFIQRRNEKLEALFDEETGPVFVYNPSGNRKVANGNPESYSTSWEGGIIELLSNSTHNAGRDNSKNRFVDFESIYSLPIRADSETILPEQEKFIEQVFKSIPGKLKSRSGEAYVADPEKIKYESKAPFIYRSELGKIELGHEAKKTLGRRMKERFVKSWALDDIFDIGFNFSDPFLGDAFLLSQNPDPAVKGYAIELATQRILATHPRKYLLEHTPFFETESNYYGGFWDSRKPAPKEPSKKPWEGGGFGW
jgi:hypothetical protein